VGIVRTDRRLQRARRRIALIREEIREYNCNQGDGRRQYPEVQRLPRYRRVRTL
jgi:hypothetical protein